MRIKGIRYGDNGGNGVYKVRLDGAVSFTKAEAPKTPPSSDAAKEMPSSFAGCWNFTGKGNFAGASLGCFKQDGDRVTFDESSFEGTVVGRTLRFASKSDKPSVLAYRSGHFVMDEGGKSFTGSINASLNPDDNESPVACTFAGPSSNKVEKDF
jgi:hypothetical protein